MGIPVLKQLLLAKKEWPYDGVDTGGGIGPWVVMTSSENRGAEFFYNRSTGEAVWVADAPEDIRLQALGPPQEDNIMLEHLHQLFTQYDADGSGELSWEEFYHVLTGLNLGLSDEDIASWQERMDADGSGTVEWGEFVTHASELVAIIGAGHDWEIEDPWVTMIDAAGNSYRLNRATGATEWLHEDQHPPSLLEHMRQLFDDYDEDGSGKLDREEFQACLESLGLGLTPAQLTQWIETLDSDRSGTIIFSEFEVHADNLLARANTGHDWSNEDPWVTMEDPASGNKYRLNRVTNATEWLPVSGTSAMESVGSEGQVPPTVAGGSAHVTSDAARAARQKDHGLFVLPLPQDRRESRLVLRCWRRSPGGGAKELVGGVALGWADLARLCGHQSVRTDYAVVSSDEYLPPPALAAPPITAADGGCAPGAAVLSPSGHFIRQHGGMVELELFAPPEPLSRRAKSLGTSRANSGHAGGNGLPGFVAGENDPWAARRSSAPWSAPVLQRVAGLSLCLSAVVEESLVAAPLAAHVVAAVQPATLPPPRRLGATRHPGCFHRTPVLSTSWVGDGAGLPEGLGTRLGASVAQRAVWERSPFAYGQPLPKAALEGPRVLQACLESPGPAFAIPGSILGASQTQTKGLKAGGAKRRRKQKKSAQAVEAWRAPQQGLEISAWDVAGFRAAEVVEVVRIQRWARRLLAARVAHLECAAATTLQRAFRKRLAPKLRGRDKARALAAAKQERVAAFSAGAHERRKREAAVKIQRWSRKCLKARRVRILALDREQMGAQAREKNDAAALIQRAFRGWRGRRAYKATLRKVKLAKANLGFARETWARMNIQRLALRWRARNEARKAEAVAANAKAAREAWKKGEAPPAAIASEAAAAGDVAANEEKGPASKEADPILEGDLVIYVVDGKALPNVDARGKSDPYVAVRYNGRRVGVTKVINNDMNPLWAHKFLLPAPTAEDLRRPTVPWGRLVLDVMDKDTFGDDDFMGRVIIDGWAALRTLQLSSVASMGKDAIKESKKKWPKPFRHFSEGAHPKDEAKALQRIRTLFPLVDRHDDDRLHELKTPRAKKPMVEGPPGENDAAVAADSDGDESSDDEAMIAAAVARQKGAAEVQYYRVLLRGARVEDLGARLHAPASDHAAPKAVHADSAHGHDVKPRHVVKAASGHGATKKPNPTFLGATGLWATSKAILAISFGQGIPALTSPQSALQTKKTEKLAREQKLKQQSHKKHGTPHEEVPSVLSWAEEEVELVVSEHFLANTPLDFRVSYSREGNKEGKTVGEAQLDMKGFVKQRGEERSGSLVGGLNRRASMFGGGLDRQKSMKSGGLERQSSMLSGSGEHNNRTMRLHKPEARKSSAQLDAEAGGGILGSLLRLGKPLSAAELARRRKPPKPRVELGLLKLEITVEPCGPPPRRNLPGHLGLVAFIDNSALRERLRTPILNDGTRAGAKKGGDDSDSDDDDSLGGHKKHHPPGDPPQLMAHLHVLFEEHDEDESGELDADEFGALIESMGLGLTAEEVVGWLEHSDADEDGVVRWDEFAPVGEQLLGDLFKSKGFVTGGEGGQGPDGTSPWVTLMGQDGFSYEYNRATGESRWLEDSAPTGDLGVWDETVDVDGYHCWHNRDTGETTYEDPTAPGGSWTEIVDGDGNQYWRNEITGEITYEEPPTTGAEPCPSEAPEVVTSVYTNERGNRVFVVQKPSAPPEALALSRLGSRDLAAVASYDEASTAGWGDDLDGTLGSRSGVEGAHGLDGSNAEEVHAAYAEESYGDDGSSGMVAGEGEWGAASQEASGWGEEWAAEESATDEWATEEY